jgi:hypothetical protein
VLWNILRCRETRKMTLEKRKPKNIVDKKINLNKICNKNNVVEEKNYN